jgi:hypothetical protein
MSLLEQANNYTATSNDYESDSADRCCICGQIDGDRPILVFPPSFSRHQLSLHVFCGKTASILPPIQPEYEILHKAGIKNKYGTGAVVNATLDQTRCAIDETRKQFYLVQEFEANLNSNLQQSQAALDNYSLDVQPLFPAIDTTISASANTSNKRRLPGESSSSGRASSSSSSTKKKQKIHCDCGGSYLDPVSHPRSWRSHEATQRHQLWIMRQQQRTQQTTPPDDDDDDDLEQGGSSSSD